jgi:hypothetical protein
MNCTRRKCDNIMCSTYVNSVGYICYECKSEFKDYLSKKGLDPKTEYQIIKEIEKFILTPVHTYVDGNEITIDDFFDNCSR